MSLGGERHWHKRNYSLQRLTYNSCSVRMSVSFRSAEEPLRLKYWTESSFSELTSLFKYFIVKETWMVSCSFYLILSTYSSPNYSVAVLIQAGFLQPTNKRHFQLYNLIFFPSNLCIIICYTIPTSVSYTFFWHIFALNIGMWKIGPSLWRINILNTKCSTICKALCHKHVITLIRATCRRVRLNIFFLSFFPYASNFFL